MATERDELLVLLAGRFPELRRPCPVCNATGWRPDEKGGGRPCTACGSRTWLPRYDTPLDVWLLIQVVNQVVYRETGQVVEVGNPGEWRAPRCEEADWLRAAVKALGLVE